MKRWVKSFIFFVWFFVFGTPTFATTRYINVDSSGAASNPTRAFDDPSYTANDSYQTLTAAYNASSDGDILEFSGGSTGKTYLTGTNLIAKSLTLRGSRLTGFSGTATIDYTGSTNYTMGIYADNMVIDNLHITRSSATGGNKVALWLFKNNSLIKNSLIDNSAGGYAVFVQTGTGVSNVFLNCVISSHGQGMGVNLYDNASTTTFNNCLINGSVNVSVMVNAGTVSYFNNCVFTANGTNTYNAFTIGTSGGIINTSNSLIQGPSLRPQAIISGTDGTYTWNSTNDIINAFPYFTRTKANLGYVLLTTDDLTNLDYFTSIANYAKDTYGIVLTIFVDNTANINSTQKSKLQTLVHAGHEVGLHTRNHSDLALANALSLTYSGANTNMAMTISSSGTTLNVTGTSDTHGPIDLTSSSYDTLGELCSYISTWSNYTCSLTDTGSGNGQASEFSVDLKDATTNLIRNVAVSIPYDDNTGPSNRRYTDEISGAIAELESAIHEDASLSSYTVKTMAFPYNSSSTAVINWIKANTNLLATRSSSYSAVRPDKVWLNNLNLYNIDKEEERVDTYGTGYSLLTLAQQKSRIEQSARVMATSVSNGYIMGMLNHNEATGLTIQEFDWYLDELVKYKQLYNYQITTLADIANQIRTSGNWTDAGGGFWTRSFSGSDNFSPLYLSPLINAGTTVGGRSSDMLGNPLVGTPDIGPYEYQAPTAPSSLAQYHSDGTTTIDPGDWTSETSVVLKFSLSSANPTDSLTPKIEIQPSDTAFSGTATHTGATVDYTGSPVTGTITITGLTAGQSYHWQAQVSNAATNSSWVTMGGSPDFSLNNATPSLSPASSVPSSTTSSSSSIPSCNSSVPVGTPDLFQIDGGKNSLTLHFSPPSMPYTGYYIAYSSKPDSWEYGVEFSQGYTGGVISYTINALNQNTLYYFKIRSANGCSTGDWGNTMVAKTTNYGKKTSYKNTQTALTQIFKNPLNQIKSIITKTTTTKKTPDTDLSTTQPSPSQVPMPTPATTPSRRCFKILWWCL